MNALPTPVVGRLRPRKDAIGVLAGENVSVEFDAENPGAMDDPLPQHVPLKQGIAQVTDYKQSVTWYPLPLWGIVP